MDSRKLEHLSIEMLACCIEFELQLKGRNIPFVRACTYRSAESQNELFAMGRTKPGRIVTWQEGGKSFHNRTKDGIPASDAADYYPLLFGALCGDKSEIELALWKRLGQIGIAAGMQWGGKWKAKHLDRPHFQLNIKR